MDRVRIGGVFVHGRAEEGVEGPAPRQNIYTPTKSRFPAEQKSKRITDLVLVQTFWRHTMLIELVITARLPYWDMACEHFP